MVVSMRRSCWETNSSTMNQIAIHKHSIDPSECEIPHEEIILDENVPTDEGVTVTDAVNKIKIVWLLIREMDEEVVMDGRDPHGFDYEEACKLFFDVLDAHGIAYRIDSRTLMNYPCVGTVGMSGITETAVELVSNRHKLVQFLFDPHSAFTWGIENEFFGMSKDDPRWEEGKAPLGYNTMVDRADYELEEV